MARGGGISLPIAKVPQGGQGGQASRNLAPFPRLAGRSQSHARMHASSTLTHMRVTRPSLPCIIRVSLPPSLPHWGHRRVPAAPWNAPRSMPECQARGTASEPANTVQRRANYAKYAAEADAAAAATTTAAALAGILTCLPSPLTRSLSFPLPPSVARTYVGQPASLGHAHIWRKEGGRERKEEEKRRKECGHDGAGRPRRE